MATSEDRWFEVWFTQGEDILPTWLLVTIPEAANSGRVLICDPLSNNKIVFSADDYDKASDWLREDEYELVEGRIFPDDGWPLGTTNVQQ